MNQRWLLMIVVVLLPYSVLAYEINLDCNGGTDVIVTTDDSVSCRFVLDEDVGNIGVNFHLHTGGIAVPDPFTTTHINYSSSVTRVNDESGNPVLDSTENSFYSVGFLDRDVSHPGGVSTVLATFDASVLAVGTYELYLELLPGDGFGDPVTGDNQPCDNTALDGSDLSLCTNAYELSPVRVRVRGEDIEPDGVFDHLEPVACVDKGTVGNVYGVQPPELVPVLGCLYGDLNGGGCVNFDDMEIIALHVDLACDASSPQGKTAAEGDINSDECVNFEDMELIALNVDLACGE